MNTLSKSLLLVLAIAAAPVARAQGGQTLSEASAMSAAGSARIVTGSLMGIQGSAELVVESVVLVADGAKCVLRGSEKVGRVILILPVKAVGAASLVVGETVTVTTEAAGWILTKAGQVIAFIPTQAGQALLHSEPVAR